MQNIVATRRWTATAGALVVLIIIAIIAFFDIGVNKPVTAGCESAVICTFIGVGLIAIVTLLETTSNVTITHVASRQVFRQKSSLSLSPSSHSSTPTSTTPSPQPAVRHVDKQSSPSLVFPSSHASCPTQITESPHRALAQLFRHASVFYVVSVIALFNAGLDKVVSTPSKSSMSLDRRLYLLDSIITSLFAGPDNTVTAPSELTIVSAIIGIDSISIITHFDTRTDNAIAHFAVVHVLVHPSVLSWLPSSHSSTPCWTMPSPQYAVEQSFRHASVSIRFPSSHCSTPAWTNWSPQRAMRLRCTGKVIPIIGAIVALFVSRANNPVATDGILTAIGTGIGVIVVGIIACFYTGPDDAIATSRQDNYSYSYRYRRRSHRHNLQHLDAQAHPHRRLWRIHSCTNLRCLHCHHRILQRLIGYSHLRTLLAHTQ